ncbi:MAG TPA: hypothetical protein ENN30_01545 [Candidatus Woesearchaeota archaeon]|nr:hypothetical protein [Candidatus Woesearchaeota archaeon]
MRKLNLEYPLMNAAGILSYLPVFEYLEQRARDLKLNLRIGADSVNMQLSLERYMKCGWTPFSKPMPRVHTVIAQGRTVKEDYKVLI